MTRRVRVLTVFLDDDYKDDDRLDFIISAVQMVKGVQSVTTTGVTSDDFINREVVKRELRDQVLAVLAPQPTKG